ncbi:uncharacterized protein FYW61_011702 [Anableps anableps]
MPKRCVAQFCDGTGKDGVSMHFFPKEPVLRRKWERFVQMRRQNFQKASRHSVLCSRHFEADDYESSMMQMFGFKAKNNTRLKKEAVPTIHAPNPRALLLDAETGLCSRPGRRPSSSSSAARKRHVSEVLAEGSPAAPGPRQAGVRGRKLPQKHVYEADLPDPLLWDQEEPEPPQIEVELQEPEPSPMEENQEEPDVLQIKVELEEPEPPQVKEEPELLQIKQEPEPAQIKEEPEEHVITEEQPVLYQEFGTLMMPQLTLPEPFGCSADDLVQSEEGVDAQPRCLETNWRPVIEPPEKLVYQAEEVSTDHELCYHDNPDPFPVIEQNQQEAEPLHAEDQEELCITQAEEPLLADQEGLTAGGGFLSLESSGSGGTPYSCRRCGKSFSQRTTLKTHRRTFCRDCRRCFDHRGNFLQHMRTHTGEKPYSCSDCGKRFTVSGGLTRHRRVHTGEKPYPCSECGKRFSQRGAWVKHLQTHGKEEPSSSRGTFYIKRFVCWFT